MTCKPAREALLRRGGHGQKRVSNRVESGCNARDRVLRVCRLDLSARATMKSGDRDLKRGIRVCGFGLERLPWPGDGLFASSTP